VPTNKIDFANDESMPFLDMTTNQYSHTKERSVYFVTSGEITLDPLKAYVRQPNFHENDKIRDMVENPLKYQKMLKAENERPFAKETIQAIKEEFLDNPEWVAKFEKKNKRKPDMHDIAEMATSIGGTPEYLLYDPVDMDEEDYTDFIVIQGNKLRPNISDSITKTYGDSVEFVSYFDK
jgi:hypothetical protein